MYNIVSGVWQLFCYKDNLGIILSSLLISERKRFKMSYLMINLFWYNRKKLCNFHFCITKKGHRILRAMKKPDSIHEIYAWNNRFFPGLCNILRRLSVFIKIWKRSWKDKQHNGNFLNINFVLSEQVETIVLYNNVFLKIQH